MKTMTILALALAAAATPSTAFALEPVTATSVVRTADLDLSNVNGERELDRRIVQAAREVCGEASNVNLEGRNAVRQCRGETIAVATAQREQLLAAARSGSPVLVASGR